uniref:Regulatory protein zeste n=1 Tax=Romanomermis culicivorax TaxID=13658 RepID=A0A915HSS9_ROMCU
MCITLKIKKQTTSSTKAKNAFWDLVEFAFRYNPNVKNRSRQQFADKWKNLKQITTIANTMKHQEYKYTPLGKEVCNDSLSVCCSLNIIKSVYLVFDVNVRLYIFIFDIVISQLSKVI